MLFQRQLVLSASIVRPSQKLWRQDWISGNVGFSTKESAIISRQGASKTLTATIWGIRITLSIIRNAQLPQFTSLATMSVIIVSTLASLGMVVLVVIIIMTPGSLTRLQTYPSNSNSCHHNVLPWSPCQTCRSNSHHHNISSFGTLAWLSRRLKVSYSMNPLVVGFTFYYLHAHDVISTNTVRFAQFTSSSNSALTGLAFLILVFVFM